MKQYLIRVSNKRAVIRSVGDAVVVRVVVTSVADAVIVGVLLTGVGGVRTIVPPTFDILTSQVHVRPSVQISIRSAKFSVSGPADLALADVVLQACGRGDRWSQKMKARIGPQGKLDCLSSNKKVFS